MNLIKKGFFLSALLLPVLAFAQDQVSDLEFLQGLLSFIGGLKGAGTLAIVAGVVQLVMQLLKTPFLSKLLPSISGATKLLIVSGLSVVGGLLVLMSDGQSFLAALMHSTTLAALQVFANQIFQQFSKKKEE